MGFLKQWWKDIFNVIFRIFDDKKLQGMHSDQERIEWMDTTCDNALRSIIDVVSQCVLFPLFLFLIFICRLKWSMSPVTKQVAQPLCFHRAAGVMCWYGGSDRDRERGGVCDDDRYDGCCGGGVPMVFDCDVLVFY